MGLSTATGLGVQSAPCFCADAGNARATKTSAASGAERKSIRNDGESGVMATPLWTPPFGDRLRATDHRIGNTCVLFNTAPIFVFPTTVAGLLHTHLAGTRQLYRRRGSDPASSVRLYPRYDSRAARLGAMVSTRVGASQRRARRSGATASVPVASRTASGNLAGCAVASTITGRSCVSR